MKTIFNILDKRPYALIWWSSLTLMVLIAGVNIAVGDVISIEPFFVLPILLASWYGSKRSGVLLAIFTSLIWAISEIVINQYGFSTENIFYNWFSYLLAYSLLAVLITNFRSVHRVEVVAADTDTLTGIPNPRGFYAKLESELLRSYRYNHMFTLAYIDIDNFKDINDSLGHMIGDELLVEVAKCLKSALRETDTVARLGGDEFSCLLPETTQPAAKKAFSKIRNLLLKSMKSHQWAVSFSMGTVTFETPPDDIKEAIRIADDLMYDVKRNNKNNIAYRIWNDKT
ncbi:MAG: GGDEF domain-containing protein [Calditrichaceae bacterium]|jgi:diguanylate cyclase (GGDEF)-like protein